MTNKYEFENKIKYYIKQSGRSQAATARLLGFHPSTLTKWLQGVNQIPFNVLQEFCELIPLDDEQRGEIFGLAGYDVSPLISEEQITLYSTPLQRPARAEHFTDRKNELKYLLTNLQPGKIITLCGPGGIGKSALAAEAVWKLAPDNSPPKAFPDGIIFHSFYNQPEANIVLEHIARTFGQEPRPTPSAAALRVLSNRQVLLILDGTENADNLPAVLAVRGTGGVLVTSRSRRDATSDWDDINPLLIADAVSLLQAWGKTWVTDDSTAQQICELVGRLPLAIRLAGRYMSQAEENANDYLAWLTETPLTALDYGKRQLDSVPLLLERSIGQVDQKAQEALGAIGVLALSSFDSPVITNALQSSVSKTKQILSELVNYGFIQQTKKRYEVSHALIHTYARERLIVSNEVVERLANYYVTFADEQQELGVTGYVQLDIERPHMMNVLAKCVERENWETAYRLTKAVNNYLDIRGYWTERVTVMEFGLKAVQKIGYRQDELTFLNKLGKTHRYLGEFQQGIEFYEQALATAKEIGDKQGEARSLNNLGIVYRNLGNIYKAIEYHKQSLAIKQEIGDRKGQAKSLNNLGVSHKDLGDTEIAIQYHKQSLDIKRGLGDRQGEADSLNNLGVAYKNLGDIQQAIDYHKQSLEIKREVGDKHGECNSLNNLGIAYKDLGDANLGIQYSEQALEIRKEIGDKQGEANSLNNIGDAYQILGQVEQAVEYHQQSLQIRREIGDKRGEASSLNSIGISFRNKTDFSQAIEYHKQALAIATEIGDRRTEGNTLGKLGNTYQDLGEIQQAIQYFNQALVISREVSDRQSEGNWLEYLGIAFRELGQLEQAKEYINQALIIFEELQLPRSISVREELAKLEG